MGTREGESYQAASFTMAFLVETVSTFMQERQLKIGKEQEI